ncbi:hypothetical protein KFE25_012946 [Diacronema lutheri]|uniref:Delta-aminolevulinic acid dehydratase n=1 Tax=Diacronema lutheri TaxID=2081491 RepID=A0A8J5X3X1_DIALT|nr:hypothetical protein KFE25_012946 [Diacronema lutheri]
MLALSVLLVAGMARPGARAGAGAPASTRAALQRVRATSAPASAAVEVDPVPNPFMQRDTQGEPWLPQRARPRRNRQSESVRRMVRENAVTAADFIYPLFIHSADRNDPIASMPGCERHSLPSMVAEAKAAYAVGVKAFVLFPKVDDALKTNRGEEAYNPAGIVPTAVRMLKAALPESVVFTDVALDPYSSEGHDGVVRGGEIVNDETIEQLCKQALCQARAGTDFVAPSDMMDGRVGAIRDALDSHGFQKVGILAYTAKYASAFYGPFRDALDSHPGFGDKKTYQQDPANGREALIELALDEAEGADMVMVKPGMPYLDVIRRLKDNTQLPVAAYHVSGEYAMLKAAAERGWLDERKAALEALLCFKRAGADVILTYYAKQAAIWLQEEPL